MMDRDDKIISAANALYAQQPNFTATELLDAIEQAEPRGRVVAALHRDGWSATRMRRPYEKTEVYGWRPPMADERPIIDAAVLDRIVAEFADPPTTPDALDPETLLAATTEQLQRSVATGEGLMRRLREAVAKADILRDFSVEMTGRWAAALCAGKIINADEVMAFVREEVSRLDHKIANMPERTFEWTTLQGDIGRAGSAMSAEEQAK